MTSNWEKFKKQTQGTPDGEKPQGRKIGTSFPCQICNKRSEGAMYYPIDSLVRYVCPDEHVNYLENFKLAF